MNLKIKNALVSVSDKENISSLLRVLKKYNIKIISSGGTYKAIKKLGYACTELSKYTGFEEMLDGRVKSLHPRYMLAFYMIDKIRLTRSKCPNKSFLLLI